MNKLLNLLIEQPFKVEVAFITMKRLATNKDICAVMEAIHLKGLQVIGCNIKSKSELQ